MNNIELPNWLLRQSQLRPDELALVAGGVRLTWGQLEAQALDTAGQLAALGVAEGSRVALLMGNGAEFARFVHALIKLGAVLVPLNTRLSADELAWQIGNCGARLLIHDEAHSVAAVEATAAMSNLPRVSADDLSATAPNSDAPLRQRIDLDATHLIIYTSGTTGRPKGALITYGNEWWSATGSAINLGNLPTDRWLAVLPLFHVGGMSILIKSAIYGVPAIIHERFDPAAVNSTIEAEGVTVISVVAAMLTRMLDERGDRSYPATLRCVLLGGGPAPLPLLERCAALGVPVVQTYGLTETSSQAATLAPADAIRKLGSAGQPLMPTEIRIWRDEVEVTPGEVGEIVVRGPTVTLGYLDRPEETARALRGGWLHTGDLGRIDSEGYLYVLDRRDDLIISGGENVYPAEVESVLLAHPGVAEAGVVGAAHERWGQVPVAYVRPSPGVTLDPEEVIAYCAARLARYKVPSHIEIMDEPLPRNAAGKLLRRELRRP